MYGRKTCKTLHDLLRDISSYLDILLGPRSAIAYMRAILTWAIYKLHLLLAA